MNNANPGRVCKNLKYSTIFSYLNSAAKIRKANRLHDNQKIHNEDGSKDLYHDSINASVTNNQFNDEPYFESDQHSRTQKIQYSDDQQPGFNLHY